MADDARDESGSEGRAFRAQHPICGNLIPAGTGLREFSRLSVHNAEEYAEIQAARAEREQLDAASRDALL